MEARDMVRRRQWLRVEELRQLVVLVREARVRVELALEPQRLAAELREELLAEVRAVRGVGRVGDELRIGLGHAAAEDAEPKRVGGRAIRLRDQALLEQSVQ